MTDPAHVIIRGEGPRNDATLHLMSGGIALPDYMTLQVEQRYYDPELGRRTSDAAGIRLTPDQQDHLLAELTRLVEARRGLDLSGFSPSIQAARAHVQGDAPG